MSEQQTLKTGGTPRIEFHCLNCSTPYHMTVAQWKPGEVIYPAGFCYHCGNSQENMWVAIGFSKHVTKEDFWGNERQ
jgi:hypothetical protein